MPQLNHKLNLILRIYGKLKEKYYLLYFRKIQQTVWIYSLKDS